MRLTCKHIQSYLHENNLQTSPSLIAHKHTAHTRLHMSISDGQTHTHACISTSPPPASSSTRTGHCPCGGAGHPHAWVLLRWCGCQSSQTCGEEDSMPPDITMPCYAHDSLSAPINVPNILQCNRKNTVLLTCVRPAGLRGSAHLFHSGAYAVQQPQ